jgi:hypothetical protein
VTGDARPQAELRQVQPVAEPLDGMEAYTGPSNLAAMSISQRINALKAVDPEAGKELALQTLHQFLMAKTPQDVIAQRMGISVGYVRILKEELRQRVRKEMREMDLHSFTGEMMAQLQEGTALAFREAAAAPAEQWARRLRSIEVAMKGITDQARLLQLGGAFDGAPLRAPIKADDDQADGATALKRLAQSFLSGEYNRDPMSIPAGAQIIDAEAE